MYVPFTLAFNLYSKVGQEHINTRYRLYFTLTNQARLYRLTALRLFSMTDFHITHLIVTQYKTTAEFHRSFRDW